MHPIAVRECVELLDITKGMMRLALDPRTQARLQATMPLLERTGRQSGAVLDGKHARLIVRHRDEKRGQLDRDIGFGRGQDRTFQRDQFAPAIFDAKCLAGKFSAKGKRNRRTGICFPATRRAEFSPPARR